MPGFTHLQTAQPVTFGHHLLAYVEMAARDRGRFADARKRLNEMPARRRRARRHLASRSTARMTAKALGFDRPTANSLDAVSDRDFVLETLAAASIAAVHLSRFAEEIVIWTSPLVGFVRLSDKFTTGSSIMPQKRNPDAAELVRAKTGRIIGALNALLVVMKGLPLAYAEGHAGGQGRRDGRAFGALAVARGDDRHGARHGAGRRQHEEGGRRGLCDRDRPRRLAGAHAQACRSARRTTSTGRIVAAAAGDGVPLHRLPLAAMQAIEPRITEEVFAVLSVERSVQSRDQLRRHGARNVRAQAKKWLQAARSRKDR